ncbi:MAG: VWA domain-containing protein [Candidatus Woesearchaeota archaeon]
MDVSFTHPEFLWFLASIPFLLVLHLITIRFTKRKAFLFANFEAIQRVGGQGFLSGGIITKNIVFLILRSFTLIFLVLSLSGMIFWYSGKSTTFDFVVAIDASGSMLADDFAPNRLAAAKDAAQIFVDTVGEHSKVGVLSFSGTTFVKQRLTDDMSLVKTAISSIDIAFTSGTAIGEAIVSSANLFEDDGQARVVAIITDGQSNVGIDPIVAVPFATRNHIKVYTLGVATPEGGKFTDIDTVSKLDENSLRGVAESTGGRYFRVSDNEALRVALAEIATTEQKDIPIQMATPLMIAVLILLFTEWIIISTRYRTIP